MSGRAERAGARRILARVFIGWRPVRKGSFVVLLLAELGLIGIGTAEFVGGYNKELRWSGLAIAVLAITGVVSLVLTVRKRGFAEYGRRNRDQKGDLQ
jgi:hypothetical protein